MSFLKNIQLPPTVNLEQTTIAFGEWLPDQADLNNPGNTEALNVIPTATGYEPFRDAVAVSGLALPAECRGGIVVSDRTETTKIFAATGTDLFIEVSGVFVSEYSGSTPVNDDLWAFCAFGDNMVAVHLEHPTQVVSISGGGAFANLGGSPPRAACAARVGDFLVLGNLDDEPDGRQAQRIRWSGFNNIASPWVTDPNTQADFNDMPSEGGSVIGIVGRETGTVFQQRSISRMTEVGLPTVFDIVVVEQERGALCKGGIVDGGAGESFTGTNIYFLAEDGFFVWNGYSSRSISNDKVNQYFFNRLNLAKANLISSALDIENQCVWWAFPAKGPLPGNNPIITDENGIPLGTEDFLDICLEDSLVGPEMLVEVMIYSYKNERWSHASILAEYIMNAPTTAIPQSLDSMMGDLDTDYAISFDDDTFDAGPPCVVSFDENHNFGPFNGNALQATIDTAMYTAPGGKRIYSNTVRPLIDVANSTVLMQSISHDQFLGGAPDYSEISIQEANGECSLFVDARYVKYRNIIPQGAAWTHALGVEIWRAVKGRF